MRFYWTVAAITVPRSFVGALLRLIVQANRTFSLKYRISQGTAEIIIRRQAASRALKKSIILALGIVLDKERVDAHPVEAQSAMSTSCQGIGCGC